MTTGQGCCSRDLMTFKVLEIGRSSDTALHSCVFITGCLPANSAESGMCSLTTWHKWLRKMESQEGWISVSVFIKPGCVSPQTKGMRCINANYHQWASVKVPDRGRRGYNLQCSFSFEFFMSWCHNNQKRKKKSTFSGGYFERVQSS